jgi:hypothetical protein
MSATLYVVAGPKRRLPHDFLVGFYTAGVLRAVLTLERRG